MTDSALLRMARIVAHLTWNTYADGDARTAEAEQLVRDLEAAPPPEPARRTITRAQHIHAMQAAQRARQFTLVGGDADDDAYRTYAVTLGLTVEDA